MAISKEQQTAFLEGLRELSLRTRITVEGCGCCGSPYLYEMSNEVTDCHYTVDEDSSNLTVKEKLITRQ